MHTLLLFWIAALVIVAAALTMLVWPLLRRRPADVPDVAPATIYRDEKRQLDDELAAGAIAPPEHAQAIDELTARLAGELQAAPRTAASTASPRAGRRWALGLAIAFPIVAVALYAFLGSPRAIEEAAQTAQTPPISQAQVVAMVDKLASHMKEHPDDATGWKLLGRSYGALGRYREAADAFHQAAQRGPVDAGLLVDWADALGMANGQSLAGEPTKLIDRALALEPGNVKALLLAATAAQERNDIPAAIDAWRRLKVELPPGSDDVRAIDALIARAEAAGDGGGGNSVTTGKAATTGESATADAAATGGNGAIRGEVSIAPSLAARVSPGDTLFIYARAIDGPRMPLAAVREPADPLPRAFTLDDSQSMRPDAKLSAAGKVVVEARISRSGNALPLPGDLFGKSAPVAPGTQKVAVVIGEVVK
ncbi:MAG TPA: c-type cytochrome biogenesis protein CcmI [Casimicrobiaceae bacterium]